MFNDARSKRIIIIAHCLLNQNSISDGTADLPSQFNTVINTLIDNNIGIVQLPCPEFLCLGLARRDEDGTKRDVLLENTRIRILMEEEENKELLRIKAQEIVKQLEEYKRYNFQLLGILGINRSPSCGMETTTLQGQEMKGRGLFMEILEEELEEKKIKLKMVGVKTSKKEDSLEKVRHLLEK